MYSSEIAGKYVIGVDGGGTKTAAALADLQGRILKIGKTGSSSPRNVGVRTAAGNVVGAIKIVLPKNKTKVASVFVGLPAVQEEFALKIGEIRKLISQKIKIKPTIDSDQLVAFRSGTDKKDGIVLIAGTGCVARGWKNGKEYKASGWGWLADEGSGFWMGQKVYQAVLKNFDGRGPQTLLTRQVNLKTLPQKIYSPDFIREVSSLSSVCNAAAEKGDKTARNILARAGKELALSVKAVIRELNFSKEKFPLVLVGSVLNSKILLNTMKKEVKKVAPKVRFIQPKKEPVVGAVRLALEYVAKS